MTPNLAPIFSPLMAIAEEAWPLVAEAYLEARSHLPIGADVGARKAPGAAKPERGIAIVPIAGGLTRRGNFISDVLGWSTYDGIAATVEKFAAMRDVERIVLQVDSPGGTVHGAEDAARAVADAAKVKPVIAVADGLMASAAYWVASGATEIVAAPGSELGSIGIVTVHFDHSKELEQDGIVATMLTAGEHKGEMHPFAPLSDGDRQAIQRRLDAQYQLFAGAVARGRRVSVDRVRTGFGRGRMLPAPDALREGLADRMGRLVDVVADALEGVRA